MGFMNRLLICVKKRDPEKDATNATRHMSIIFFQSIFTCFTYCFAAKKVPLKDGIFSEPITVATGSLGNKIKEAGVCINPPPPTMASTKPARLANKHSKMSVVVSNFYADFGLDLKEERFAITKPLITSSPLNT